MIEDTVAISCTHFNRNPEVRIDGDHYVNGRKIPDGFWSNGSSVRGFITWLLWIDPFHPDIFIYAVGHDRDYAMGYPRKAADKDYLNGWLRNGEGKSWWRKPAHWLRGYGHYIGLRIGGWVAYNKCKEARK